MPVYMHSSVYIYHLVYIYGLGSPSCLSYIPHTYTSYWQSSQDSSY